jgi:lysophospholipase L1-like esterase
MTTLRICFVGDSITTGTGDDDYLGWPGRLCAAERRRGHDISIYNLGYLDLLTPLATDPRWRKALAEGDSLHPSASGYALMAELIGKWPAWRKWFD